MADLEKVDFPYYKHYVDNRFIGIVFTSFKKFRPKIEKMSDDKQEIFTVNVDFKREYPYLFLSDYFTQKARMKSRFLDKQTPLEMFRKKRQHIIDQLGKTPDYNTVYTYLWENSKMCSTFPVTVAKAIIDHYKPKRVFDPSAGWGDRMLACMACDVSYQGVDPNRELVSGYQQMISVLKADERKYGLVSLPIEEYTLQNMNEIDMILTSPPFFNMEHYSEDSNQSERRYSSYDEWKRRFLYPLLRRCYLFLQVGGHFIIYVNNIKYYPILDDTLSYMENMARQGLMSHEGYICWKNTKYPKKLLVYRKLKKSP